METDIIFLDTSIFENQNFFRGHSLLKIAELSKNSIIQLKITEITFKEVNSRMLQNLRKANSSIRKAENLMDNEAKILKNVSDYDIYYPLKRFDIDYIHYQLCVRFENFLKDNKIEVVSLEGASISDVFDKYFNAEKPFGEGKKKSEFPDAFTLDIITKWCEKEKKRAYVIATDGDITDYKCEKDLIIVFKEISEFLVLLIKKEKGVLLVKYLEEAINGSIDDVVKVIKDSMYFEDLPYELNQRLLSSNGFDDVDAYLPTITGSEIEESSIIYLDDEDGVVASDMVVKMEINLPIDYYDYDGAWYDKEDDVWYGRKRIEEILECTIRIRVDAEYHFNFDDDKKLLDDFELNDIKEYNLEDFDYIDRDEY
jgi:PIN domain